MENQITFENIPEKWSSDETALRGAHSVLNDLLEEKYEKRDLDIYLKIRARILQLLNSFAERHQLEKYAAYHILIGSSPCYSQCIDFDFPGCVSIRAQLVGWINLLQKKSKKQNNAFLFQMA